MKTITQLQAGKVEDIVWSDPRGNAQGICDQPVPGFFRSAHLGAAGIVFKRGDKAVAIPLALLFELVAEIEPDFVPPKPEVVKRAAKQLAAIESGAADQAKPTPRSALRAPRS